MLRLICIKLRGQSRHKGSQLSYAHLFSTSSLKPASKLPNYEDSQSSTVSFLQTSCGLSLESAISASEKLNVENPNNPNSVLDLLRTHGLTQTHIRNLISSRPTLLAADLDNTLKPNMELFQSLGFSSTSLAKLLGKDPRLIEADACGTIEFFRAHGFSDKQISNVTMKRPALYTFNTDKIFKPKLEFFKSLGFSDLEIAKLLSTAPTILERSLEKQIIPCVQELRRILGNDENVVKAIRLCYFVIESSLEKVLQPNISTLISHGVPHSLVSKLFLIQPKSLLLSNYRFSEVVSEVTKLGFDPNNLLFVLAIRVMGAMSKMRWEQKVETYRSFGLSKEELYSAFKRQPLCMITSQEKVRKVMPFFLSKLKMKPLEISNYPDLLLLSLEKRIIPRCSVVELLLSKGLIKANISIVSVLKMTEKRFLEKLVCKYQNEVPDVVRAYQGKIEFKGFLVDLQMPVSRRSSNV